MSEPGAGLRRGPAQPFGVAAVAGAGGPFGVAAVVESGGPFQMAARAESSGPDQSGGPEESGGLGESDGLREADGPAEGSRRPAGSAGPERGAAASAPGPAASARRKLRPEHYDFFAGGAGEETALRENERAFGRLALLPRVLRGGADLGTRVSVLGREWQAPLFVSPTAFHRLAHPDGELATARAAAATGIPLVTSMAATTAVADVVAAAREADSEALVWFQLYPQPEHEVTAELVRRAERAGCRALVVTVDSPVFGRRTRDLRNGFHDLPPGLAAENMRDLPGAAPGSTRDIAMWPAGWDDLARLRELTDLPVVLKGVLHPEDARTAVEQGVDALLVSNHGGRQLDAAPASVEALPAVVEAVAGRVPVLMDGGVRRGTDIALALALGARAVGVGRPVLWALATGGEDGVREVLTALREDFAHVLTLCGGRRPEDLTADQVVPRGLPYRPGGPGRGERAW
ncbi:alpha-hydroxy acid oxidase [Streptomyces sp. P10-4]|uniref:alpha-hydroxy acid oxidase n=1 Tax=Streptomyces sp. P10-4 TaxID=3421645 RepID=UPI003D2A0D8F